MKSTNSQQVYYLSPNFILAALTKGRSVFFWAQNSQLERLAHQEVQKVLDAQEDVLDENEVRTGSYSPIHTEDVFEKVVQELRLAEYSRDIPTYIRKETQRWYVLEWLNFRRAIAQDIESRQIDKYTPIIEQIFARERAFFNRAHTVVEAQQFMREIHGLYVSVLDAAKSAALGDVESAINQLSSEVQRKESGKTEPPALSESVPERNTSSVLEAVAVFQSDTLLERVQSAFNAGVFPAGAVSDAVREAALVFARQPVEEYMGRTPLMFAVEAYVEGKLVIDTYQKEKLPEAVASITVGQKSEIVRKFRDEFNIPLKPFTDQEDLRAQLARDGQTVTEDELVRMMQVGLGTATKFGVYVHEDVLKAGTLDRQQKEILLEETVHHFELKYGHLYGITVDNTTRGAAEVRAAAAKVWALGTPPQQAFQDAQTSTVIGHIVWETTRTALPSTPSLSFDDIEAPLVVAAEADVPTAEAVVTSVRPTAWEEVRTAIAKTIDRVITSYDFRAQDQSKGNYTIANGKDWFINEFKYDVEYDLKEILPIETGLQYGLTDTERTRLIDRLVVSIYNILLRREKIRQQEIPRLEAALDEFFAPDKTFDIIMHRALYGSPTFPASVEDLVSKLTVLLPLNEPFKTYLTFRHFAPEAKAHVDRLIRTHAAGYFERAKSLSVWDTILERTYAKRESLAYDKKVEETAPGQRRPLSLYAHYDIRDSLEEARLRALLPNIVRHLQSPSQMKVDYVSGGVDVNGKEVFPIGGGTARKVYTLDNGQVLKHEPGVHPFNTKVEVGLLAVDPSMESVLPIVRWGVASDGLYLIEPRVTPVRSEDLITLSTFRQVFDTFKKDTPDGQDFFLRWHGLRSMAEVEALEKLFLLAEKYKVGDFAMRPNDPQVGRTADGKIVALDFGLAEYPDRDAISTLMDEIAKQARNAPDSFNQLPPPEPQQGPNTPVSSGGPGNTVAQPIADVTALISIFQKYGLNFATEVARDVSWQAWGEVVSQVEHVIEEVVHSEPTGLMGSTIIAFRKVAGTKQREKFINLYYETVAYLLRQQGVKWTADSTYGITREEHDRLVQALTGVIYDILNRKSGSIASSINSPNKQDLVSLEPEVDETKVTTESDAASQVFVKISTLSSAALKDIVGNDRERAASQLQMAKDSLLHPLETAAQKLTTASREVPSFLQDVIDRGRARIHTVQSILDEGLTLGPSFDIGPWQKIILLMKETEPHELLLGSSSLTVDAISTMPNQSYGGTERIALMINKKDPVPQDSTEWKRDLRQDILSLNKSLRVGYSLLELVSLKQVDLPEPVRHALESLEIDVPFHPSIVAYDYPEKLSLASDLPSEQPKDIPPSQPETIVASVVGADGQRTRDLVQFTLTQFLGNGSIGDVYLAKTGDDTTHTVPGVVVVKTAGDRTDENLTGRLLPGAESLIKIRNVARGDEIGLHAFPKVFAMSSPDAARPSFAMEFIDLHAFQTAGFIDAGVGNILSLAVTYMDAMDLLNKAGIAQHDRKLEDIVWWDEYGKLKILDWDVQITIRPGEEPSIARREIQRLGSLMVKSIMRYDQDASGRYFFNEPVTRDSEGSHVKSEVLAKLNERLPQSIVAFIVSLLEKKFQTYDDVKLGALLIREQLKTDAEALLTYDQSQLAERLVGINAFLENPSLRKGLPIAIRQATGHALDEGRKLALWEAAVTEMAIHLKSQQFAHSIGSPYEDSFDMELKRILLLRGDIPGFPAPPAPPAEPHAPAGPGAALPAEGKPSKIAALIQPIAEALNLAPDAIERAQLDSARNAIQTDLQTRLITYIEQTPEVSVEMIGREIETQSTTLLQSRLGERFPKHFVASESRQIADEAKKALSAWEPMLTDHINQAIIAGIIQHDEDITFNQVQQKIGDAVTPPVNFSPEFLTLRTKQLFNQRHAYYTTHLAPYKTYLQNLPAETLRPLVALAQDANNRPHLIDQFETLLTTQFPAIDSGEARQIAVSYVDSPWLTRALVAIAGVTPERQSAVAALTQAADRISKNGTFIRFAASTKISREDLLADIREEFTREGVVARLSSVYDAQTTDSMITAVSLGVERHLHALASLLPLQGDPLVVLFDSVPLPVSLEIADNFIATTQTLLDPEDEIGTKARALIAEGREEEARTVLLAALEKAEIFDPIPVGVKFGEGSLEDRLTHDTAEYLLRQMTAETNGVVVGKLQKRLGDIRDTEGFTKSGFEEEDRLINDALRKLEIYKTDRASFAQAHEILTNPPAPTVVSERIEEPPNPMYIEHARNAARDYYGILNLDPNLHPQGLARIYRTTVEGLRRGNRVQQVLGRVLPLRPLATAENIDRAYTELQAKVAQKTFFQRLPGVGPWFRARYERLLARTIMPELAEAHTILGNPMLRTIYDARLAEQGVGKALGRALRYAGQGISRAFQQSKLLEKVVGATGLVTLATTLSAAYLYTNVLVAPPVTVPAAPPSAVVAQVDPSYHAPGGNVVTVAPTAVATAQTMTAYEQQTLQDFSDVQSAKDPFIAFFSKPFFEFAKGRRAAYAQAEGDTYWLRLLGKANPTQAEKDQVLNNPVVSFLLLGSDARSQANETFNWSRNDQNIIVYVNTQTGQISLTAVDRLLLMADGNGLNTSIGTGLPDDPTTTNINESRALPGIDNKDPRAPLANSRLRFEWLTGHPIDSVTIGGFDGFANAIDAMYPHGISITSQATLYHVDTGQLAFEKGKTYQMNGQQALLYVRLRTGEGEVGGTTFGRSFRMDQVIGQILLDFAGRGVSEGNFNEALVTSQKVIVGLEGGNSFMTDTPWVGTNGELDQGLLYQILVRNNIVFNQARGQYASTMTALPVLLGSSVQPIMFAPDYYDVFWPNRILQRVEGGHFALPGWTGHYAQGEWTYKPSDVADTIAYYQPFRDIIDRDVYEGVKVAPGPQQPQGENIQANKPGEPGGPVSHAPDAHTQTERTSQSPTTQSTVGQ